MWLLQPRVKYIWVHLKPIRLKAHLGLVEAECWLQAREPGHTPPQKLAIPLPPSPICLHTPSSSCGFCQTASFGMRPQADSVPLPPHCSLKKVNTWQKLTELKWDHWLFSRKGVTTHPSDECLIELAELHYSTSSFFTLTSVLCPPFLLQLTRLWHPKHSECRGKVCELGMKQFFQDHQEVSLGI